jgi:hypothetical protein
VGSFTACPLADAFFKESVVLIHSERRKGRYLGWRG